MTLNDKINKIAGTVKELAGAIENQYEMEPGTLDKSCVGFEDYPKLVREIPSKSGGMSLTTVFAYAKGDNYEVYPDGGSFNPETGSIEYPEGWSDGNFIARNRSTQSPIWQSHAIFSSNGEMMQTWTPPVRITGMDGVQGPAGPAGPQGEQGPQGPPGTAGGVDGTDGYRMEFIYKRVADETVVDTIQAPTSIQEDKDVPSGWTNNPEGVNDDLQVELICQREKENNIWGEWSDPAIWAMYGKIGRDGNGVEYIYKLTKDETVNPGQPIAPSNILPESYPSDWSDDPLSVTETNTVCWVSIRKQHYDGDSQIWGPYSAPSVWAKYGKDGKDGGGRTIFIYTYTETISAPDMPVGGSWDPETNIIIPPVGWEENTDELVKGKYLWMSYASFNSAGTNLSGWQAPARLTGEDGHNGTDGSSIEFIYRLISNYDNYNQLLTWLEKNPLDKTQTAEVPATKDSIIDTKWTDEPSGIDGERYTIEVVSSRVYTESGWSDWSKPVLWAMWGEDGMDGPGVEYIYLVTPEKHEGVELVEMTSDIVLNNYMPDLNEMLKHPRYQEWEFVPNDEFSVDGFDYSGYDWTDEPSDVGPSEPLEWVSVRKGVVDQTTGKVTWGPFSAPKLWAKYSEDGVAYKTSYVFARGEKPKQPKGGCFEFAYPTVNGSKTGEKDPIWFDSIPEGDGIVWMSMRTFRSIGEIDGDWSAPRQMTDTANFQVEFTKFDLSTISGYTITPYEGDEDAWRAAEAKKGISWDEGENMEGALYMATVTCHNGVWGNWTVTKIKGEKGDAGEPGQSVKVEGKFATLAELKAAWTSFVGGDASKFVGGTLDPGDGYFVEERGLLYIYSGGWSASETDSDFDLYWVGVELKGEPGDSAQIYIRYSDDGESFTANNGTVPGKYVGTYVCVGAVEQSIIDDPNSYKPWYLWNGEDGWGYEQIFVLTTDKYNVQNPPLVPTDNTATPEYLPAHNLGNYAPGTDWCDTPQTISEEYPYCWVVTRTRQGSEFGPWKGSEIDGKQYAHLYSRHAYDGTSYYQIELSNDQAVIPLENGKVDPDFNDVVTTQISLYCGSEPVESGVEYSADNTEAASCNKSTGLVTLNNKKLDDVSVIVCKAKYNGKTYTKNFYIHKTNNAYELTTNKSILYRVAETGLLEEKSQEVTVTVKRWDGTKWTVPDNKILFAKVEHLIEEPKFIESDLVNWDDKYAEFNFEDELYPTKIRFYLTENNEPNGPELAFEEIGVVSNGQDGPGQEYIYYLCNVDYTTGGLKNPTPTNINTDEYKQPNWHDAEFNGIKWTDEPSGVSETNQYEYVSSRKKVDGVWSAFSDPALWAKYGERGPEGPQGEPSWSWRLSDPIEMISYNSDGTPNGSINASTTVLANCGGHVANVQITEVTAGYGSYNGDTFTLNALPTDGSDFTIMIKAKGTWGTYTDEAELRYTVKKWFGEPATVQVHLSNDSSPVTTDSNGNYPNNVIRTVELTASSGKTNVNITNITTSNTTIGLDWTAPELKITIPTNATGWSNDDVLTIPLVCILADGYDPQTVIMSFYKVRAAKDAEYPDVYDLLVNPTSILVSVNQETGEANYETTTVTPTIIKYTATNETKVLTVSEFNKLNVGSIEYSFDGSNNIHTLSGDTFTILGKDDADEYVDVVMKITGGKTQTERILISHDPIPNIDWELELNCPERILYKSDKTTQITNVKNVACRLYKTVGGVKNYVDIPQDYFGFDIELYLDGVQQTSPYTIDDIIALDKFINSCEFVLVNQGGEGEEDVIWDRKLVTKEYAEAGPEGPEGPQGPSGSAGKSTLVYDFTNNHIPVVPHMKNYGLGNGAGTEIHVYYGLTELTLEAHNNAETDDSNKLIAVKCGDKDVLSSEGERSYWGFNKDTKIFSFGAGLIDWLRDKGIDSEYWKFDITVQVTVDGQPKQLTKGLYLYKAESLRPKLSITPNVIKDEETTELTIQVLGADNQWVNKWYNNDDYAITINGTPWKPKDDSPYPIGENPEPLNIVLYKDGKFADAETIPVLRDGTSVDESSIEQIVINKVTENLNKAEILTKDQLEEATKQLSDALVAEQQARESGDQQALDKAQTAVANAAAAVNTANQAQSAIDDLNNLFTEDADGQKVLTKNALSAEDIYDISVAALGSDIDNSDENGLHEDSIFAQKIVGLVATYGTVTANHITGNEISGHTIQSSEFIENTTDPRWKLDKDGSGYLANKKIEWTKNGVLTIEGMPVVTVDKDKIATFTIDKTKVFDVYQDENNEQYINALLPFAAPSITAKVNTATSDMTLKDVVKDVDLSVDELANAPTFVFDWKDGSGRSVGTSAQYWQDVLPEAVTEGKNLSLAYGNVALVGMSSLARRVIEQDREIAELKALVNELINKLS